MESGEIRGSRKKSRRLCCIVAVLAVVLLLIIAIALGVSLSRRGNEFKNTFMQRCEKFEGYNCTEIWDAFQKAYVDRDQCDVPPEAYDSLIEAAPLETSCNRMMFWSKTKDVAQDLAAKGDCFLTVERTLLGSVLDGLTWCGKRGSDETLTTGCPEWNECVKNPVRSFWNRVSAAFGDAACGDVTAMLNASIPTPFDPKSIFASIEVKRFKSSKVKKLDIVLVTEMNSVTNCTNKSLQDLQNMLDKGIIYSCLEVQKSQIQKCSSDPNKSCGSCW
ncbi:PREDICTED: ADP-ribosyl cyclase/cyclic ADP-ribose hydrolase 1-like [Cyprinodon variegatus]|uniref:ADP-ribosyl cyclase/cyclic ADP-ribose hydrolase n=2 Tax=Cyprinodon variegatus TaxID=28743 RepID=A0A3Q2DWV6_CYPVA|nr:PREDICTED: ADP-ribosyl cyclase/cyclic ADP-ribose hydrolase 1-like [Cyprinodon variegatus]